MNTSANKDLRNFERETFCALKTCHKTKSNPRCIGGALRLPSIMKLDMNLSIRKKLRRFYSITL